MTEAQATRAMVIGLDCAEPSLVEAWRDQLPTLSALMDRGVHGRLTSVIPPITVPWGDGGYYARIFLNVRGREPAGVVAPENYEAVRDDLSKRLAAIPDDQGRPMATRVYKPEELYEEVNGVAPDLIVVFGDLLWRSVATVGGEDGVHTLENDTGPDDANHAQDGMIVAAGAGVGARGRLDAHLLDIAPTVLELLGLDVPDDMRGRSLAGDLAG